MVPILSVCPAYLLSLSVALLIQAQGPLLLPLSTMGYSGSGPSLLPVERQGPAVHSCTKSPTLKHTPWEKSGHLGLSKCPMSQVRTLPEHLWSDPLYSLAAYNDQVTPRSPHFQPQPGYWLWSF